MTRILSFSDQTPADLEAEKSASRTNGCLGWLIGILLIAIIAAILYPLFAQHQHTGPGTAALSNLRQLATATIIYTTDYDDRFPHATALPGIRASIMPYCKNINLFKPTHQSSAPEFNFNYSGTTLDQIPIGNSDVLTREKTTIWYAISKIKDKPGAFHSRIDSSAKFSQYQPFFESFQYQFDRTDVTLAPADYLADQDPLRK